MRSTYEERLKELLEEEVVLVCAEFGMGRTMMLSRSVMLRMSEGVPTRFVDCVGMKTDAVLLRIKDAQQWCVRSRRRTAGGEPKVFLALDNVDVGDEPDVERLAKAIRRIVAKRAQVMLASTPAGELLAEQLGEARCLWSSDLRMARPADERGARMYDEYTQGVPALCAAIASMDEESKDRAISDPVFQNAFTSVMESGICAGIMEEERRLRCVMFLLGHGTRASLQEVLGPIDNEIWRTTARDAPLFGIDVLHETFSCVGARTLDAMSVLHATLEKTLRPHPRLVGKVARMLFALGNVLRAAAVSLLCSDDAERCALLLRQGTALLEAGEVDMVRDVLETAREQGLEHMAGYAESTCALAALTGEGLSEARVHVGRLRDGSIPSAHARLAWWCRTMLREDVHAACPKAIECLDFDPTVRMLLLHGRALSCMLDGHLRSAYNMLLSRARETGRPTVSSFLVTFDLLVCSLLQGIVPSADDVRAMQDERRFCEHAGLTRLNELCDVVLSACAVVSGRSSMGLPLEALIQRASREGNQTVQGVLLLLSGICDMRVRAFTRGHVKLGQAQRIFDEVSAPNLRNVACLLHVALRAHLGEQVGRSDVDACRRNTKAVDAAVRLLSASVGKKAPAPLSIAGRWSVESPMREGHWLVNVLANDCGDISRNVQKAMPESWMQEQIGITARIDEFVGSLGVSPALSAGQGHAKGFLASAKNDGAAEQAPLEIRLLGRFEVYVDGALVPNGKFSRRRAEALLILLAAIPGHAAKRYAIMESIWPTYDYSSASKCVYSATSVLRERLRTTGAGGEALPVIVTNKVQGTLSLNASILSTDVDCFESKARDLLDERRSSREAILLCREIEELYRGHLFVPPTDGMGIVEERSREMRELFADAMLVGARAAMETRMWTLACRFARKSHDTDPLREDALQVLVDALCAAGRHVEARRLYEQFVGHVVDVTRRPPSKRLREEVEERLGEFFRDATTSALPPERKEPPQQLSFSLGEE